MAGRRLHHAAVIEGRAHPGARDERRTAMISEAVLSRVARLEGEVIGRAISDGFCPRRMDWKLQGELIDKKHIGNIELVGTSIDWSRLDAKQEFYERILTNCIGQVSCGPDMLAVTYEASAKIEGIEILGRIFCYVNHPMEYREALLAAGVIQKVVPRCYETINCRI
jgi:hypothetical protein